MHFPRIAYPDLWLFRALWGRHSRLSKPSHRQQIPIVPEFREEPSGKGGEESSFQGSQYCCELRIECKMHAMAPKGDLRAITNIFAAQELTLLNAWNT